MSQHDLNIANQGFPAFRADLNDALVALGSTNSGATAPATPYANQLWYDTANNILKIRNEDNDAWISITTLDQANDVLSAISLNTINEGTSASGVTVDGVLLKDNAVTASADSTISGLTVGKGGGSILGNTVVGYQAGISNTSGVEFTAYGYQAGYSHTTGQYNAFFGGRGCGYSVTNGIQNSFFGDYAGRGVTTGSQNTLIGQGAGFAITTGSKHTLLGVYTGNNDGLDIRTSSGYAVISDGDGYRLLSTYRGGTLALDGGAVPVAGTGITFPATQSASSNVNTLDDYEEGTWSPSVGGNATYSTDNRGTYVKIGKMVTVHFDLIIGTLGTGSTTAITNFPFASSGDGMPRAGCCSYYAGLTVSPIFIAFYLANNSTSCAFVWNTAGGGTIGFNASPLFGNGSRVTGNLTYTASA
jgi:hypothetical protein